MTYDEAMVYLIDGCIIGNDEYEYKLINNYRYCRELGTIKWHNSYNIGEYEKKMNWGAIKPKEKPSTKRLTNKFCDNTILPMMPISPYYDLEELEKFHEVRRIYEECIIRLSEYEDIGTVEQFRGLKEARKARNEARLY